MKRQRQQAGFSLMEVNMAVFVMAVGILSMVVLYPLGLRESTQGQADLKQSMFADYVLNQIVAAAGSPDLTWAQWTPLLGPGYNGREITGNTTIGNTPVEVVGNWKVKGQDQEIDMRDAHFQITCYRVPDTGDKIMGIVVRSTDVDLADNNLVTNNPAYYAEVLFQGKN